MSTRNEKQGRRLPRKLGVAGVVFEQGKLLVIRRSQHVSAPGRICFPGGAIEDGEFEEQAVAREFFEEMGVDVTPVRRLWRCITHWNIDLAWWHVQPPSGALFSPNPLEVAEFFWFTPRELEEHPDLLDSNKEFLKLLASGEIILG